MFDIVCRSDMIFIIVKNFLLWKLDFISFIVCVYGFRRFICVLCDVFFIFFLEYYVYDCNCKYCFVCLYMLGCFF